MSNGPHKLYIACKKTGGRGAIKKALILGFLKVGKKNLFLRMSDMSATLREVEPICVLDFYVHESLQRQGIGLKLMNNFFNDEGVTPEAVAYDRPSTKLICFLRKHFGLQDYTNQSNNYVVFRKFWDLDKKIQQRQHKGQYEKEDSKRQTYGMWTTINQRPLSGTKSKGRTKVYAQSPQHSPQPNVSHNNRYSPHSIAYNSPTNSSDVLQRNNNSISNTNSYHQGFPQYGRRAYKYDPNDIISQALQQERTQKSRNENSPHGLGNKTRSIHNDATSHMHDNNENDIDRRIFYGRRARDFHDFDNHIHGHSTYMESSRIPTTMSISASLSVQNNAMKSTNRLKHSDAKYGGYSYLPIL